MHIFKYIIEKKKFSDTRDTKCSLAGLASTWGLYSLKPDLTHWYMLCDTFSTDILQSLKDHYICDHLHELNSINTTYMVILNIPILVNKN